MSTFNNWKYLIISGLLQWLLRQHETTPYYIIYSFNFRYTKANESYDLKRDLSQILLFLCYMHNAMHGCHDLARVKTEVGPKPLLLSNSEFRLSLKKCCYPIKNFVFDCYGSRMSVSTECQFPLLTFQNGKFKTYFSVFMPTLDKTYRRMATTITSFDRDPRDGNSGKN